MPTITEDIDLPGGVDPTAVRVELQLWGDGAPVTAFETTSGKTIAGIARTTGTPWTIANVVGNPDIDLPAGTVYRVVRTWPGLTDPLIDYISVPSGGGPHRVDQILTDPPGSIASAALTSHQGNASAHQPFATLAVTGAATAGSVAATGAVTAASATVSGATSTGSLAVTGATTTNTLTVTDDLIQRGLPVAQYERVTFLSKQMDAVPGSAPTYTVSLDYPGWDMPDGSTTSVVWPFAPPRIGVDGSTHLFWTTFEAAVIWVNLSAAAGNVRWRCEIRNLAIGIDVVTETPAHDQFTTMTAAGQNVCNAGLIATNVPVSPAFFGSEWAIKVSRIGGDAADTLAGSARLAMVSFNRVT